jgi:predicted MFS family arabinose efflux permease
VQKFNMTQASSPRSALWRHRDFLRLWSAQTVSDFGARITREGLPMMAVMALAATAPQLGVLAALASGSALLVGLSMGDFVDHTLRRPILIGMDLARALVLIALPIAAWLGHLNIWEVYAAAALVAAGSVLFDIADHAYLPGLVGRPLLVDANTKITATESIAEIGGPSLAGVLFQWLTAPIAVAVNAATYLLSAVILAGIRTPEPPPADAGQRRGWIDGVVTGARTSWAEPRVRMLLIMTGVGAVFGGFFSALYIAYVLRDLGLSPGLLGLGIATGGVGALTGSMLAQFMARRLGVGLAICVSSILSALGTMIVLLAPTDTVGATPALMVSQFLGDAFGVVPLILAGALRQSILPQSLLGRVGATFRVAGGGAAVVGALVGGGLGQAVGLREALLIAIAGLMIGPVLGAFSSLRAVREMPVGP